MTTFNEINLQVGAKLQMTLKFGSQQSVFYTELIGYAEDDYLIIKIPFENGFIVQIEEGLPLNFRIFSGVNIFTFSCTVKHVFLAPFCYMHTSFPTDIQATAIRNAIRAKADFSVRIKGQSKSATMTDISVSGAGITADEKLGELGDDLFIYFRCPVSLTHQKIEIRTFVKICSVHQLPGKQQNTPPKWGYGVMFHDISPTNQVILQNFVYESLNRKSVGTMQ
ncbi:MAG: flagellar brake protein [Methylovulum sp.]|nr:flagellar brake protein [Methylovulum sp.]